MNRALILISEEREAQDLMAVRTTPTGAATDPTDATDTHFSSFISARILVVSCCWSLDGASYPIPVSQNEN